MRSSTTTSPAPNAAASTRPQSSVGTNVTASRPMPAIRRALCTELWASAPVTTRSGGAPARPRWSTSQPRRASRASRPARMPVRLATVAPPQNVATAPGGIPSRSQAQAAANPSRWAATGDMTGSAAFWSHAPARIAAAWAAGSVPPVTKPKYRPPFDAIVAGDPRRSRRSSTAAGRSRPRAARRRSPPSAAIAAAGGTTARSPTPAPYAAARAAASSTTSRRRSAVTCPSVRAMPALHGPMPPRPQGPIPAEVATPAPRPSPGARWP